MNRRKWWVWWFDFKSYHIDRAINFFLTFFLWLWKLDSNVYFFQVLEGVNYVFFGESEWLIFLVKVIKEGIWFGYPSEVVMTSSLWVNLDGMAVLPNPTDSGDNPVASRGVPIQRCPIESVLNNTIKAREVRWGEKAWTWAKPSLPLHPTHLFGWLEWDIELF